MHHPLDCARRSCGSEGVGIRIALHRVEGNILEPDWLLRNRNGVTAAIGGRAQSKWSIADQSCVEVVFCCRDVGERVAGRGHQEGRATSNLVGELVV